MGLLCLFVAKSAFSADTAASLAASARAECDAGRRAVDRAERKAHFERGQALGERAVALDDNYAEAHFGVFCNMNPGALLAEPR